MEALFLAVCGALPGKIGAALIDVDQGSMTHAEFSKLLKDAGLLSPSKLDFSVASSLFARATVKQQLPIRATRMSLNEFKQAMDLVAREIFPGLTFEGRMHKLTREHLADLCYSWQATLAEQKNRLHFKMSQPTVVTAIQRHHTGLTRMFSRFVSLHGVPSGPQEAASNAEQVKVLSTKQLMSLAEHYEIVPHLISREAAETARAEVDKISKSQGLNFEAFTWWIGAVAEHLFTNGYDDLAPNGFEKHYPRLDNRIERLLFDIDRSGVLFSGLDKAALGITPCSPMRSSERQAPIGGDSSEARASGVPDAEHSSRAKQEKPVYRPFWKNPDLDPGVAHASEKAGVSAPLQLASSRSHQDQAGGKG